MIVPRSRLLAAALAAANSDSQYHLWVYKGGRYQVEGENGVSCTVVVER